MKVRGPGPLCRFVSLRPDVRTARLKTAPMSLTSPAARERRAQPARGGYSSLSYLQGFPVDTLKIDRSFVIGMDRSDECREIIRTILNLARTLRLEVIAEGAETAAQVEFLEGLDCGFLQGYFFSRPVPPDELAALLLGRGAGEDPVAATPTTSHRS